ncbi:MAG: aldehyde dehydrogenase family protein [Ginsengibacter sp.]
MRMSNIDNMNDLLKKLNLEQNNRGTSTGVNWINVGDEKIISSSPVDGKIIGSVQVTDKKTYDQIVDNSLKAFRLWRSWPAPKRGQIVKQISNELIKHKNHLGKLVSYEMGKSLQEGLGEVQEMIDICDFALGLSRQLYGSTMHSERPGHRMYDQYHPLGIVGIISAFNFPVAVWSWNSMIAMVCGNVTIWKPSEKTPLCAIACMNIISDVLKDNNVPDGVVNLINGDKNVGEWMAADKRISLISATGSTNMGKQVAATVASRLGKSLLELGGNNGIIISDKADLKIALIGCLFGSVGTAGQRCTTTRRLIIHENIYEGFKNKLLTAYNQLKIGDPLNEQNHIGPLIDEDAVMKYINAIKSCKAEGGKFLVEGEILKGKGYESGCYVKPCIAEVENNFEIVQQETFAPILYLIKYKDLKEAIQIQNNVPQGLSSSIFTQDIKESEYFLSASGSDCGIANVNIGTSGAEIGGAFGGEKETGGGRESGSDAWKAYMRRQTTTINFTHDLPLAQGIKFTV